MAAPLLQRPSPGLDRYRRTLPPEEFAALEAWTNSFFPFQRSWLLDDSDFAICNKARQIGMSHTTSGVGVLWGAFHGELTTVISVGKTEAAEVLDKAKKHIYVLRGLGSQLARAKASKWEISFASGGRILALPSSGGRGFTGNVFLDEFAYQEFAKKVWDAAAPVSLLGFRTRVSSTPNGLGNEFADLVKLAKAEGSGWSHHEIPIRLAIAQGFPVDIAKCWRIAKQDPRLFAQFFECSFLDSEFQYISNAQIEAATCPLIWPESPVCYAGLDIGRTNDRTALVIVASDDVLDERGRLVERHHWVVHVETRKRTKAEDIDALVALAFGKPFFCKRLVVDSTGLGAFPAETLQKRYGRHAVIPFEFTNPSKEDLATTLFQTFVDKSLRLPAGNEPEHKALREDIAAIRRLITPHGNIRYDAPVTDQGHADRAWGLALALHAACGPNRQRYERGPGTAA